MSDQPSNIEQPPAAPGPRKILKPKAPKATGPAPPPLPAATPARPAFSFLAPVAISREQPSAASIELDQVRAKLSVAENEIARFTQAWTEEFGRHERQHAQDAEAHQHNLNIMNALTKENDELRKKLAKAEQDSENKEKDLQHAGTEFLKLEAELKQEQAKLANLKSELEKEKKETAEREQHIAHIENQAAEATKQNEKLTLAQEKHDEELKRERRAVAEAKKERNAIKKQFDNFVDDQKNLTAELLAKEAKALKEEITAKDKEIVTLRTANSEAATIQKEMVNGLQEEINQLKADARVRMNTHPGHYTDTKKSTKKPADLQRELDDEIDNEDDTTESSSDSNSDSDDQKTDAPPPKEKIVYVEKVVFKDKIIYQDREVRIEVPGPVVTNTVYQDRIQTRYRTILNPDRLAGWFGTERDLVVILAQGVITVIALVLSLDIGSILRTQAVYDDYPVDNYPGAKAQGNGNNNNTGSGPTNMQASVYVGLNAAPNGPSTGTDPSDAAVETDGTTNSNLNVNLADLLDPVDQTDNQVPLEGENGNRVQKTSNGSSGSAANQATGGGGGGNPGDAGAVEREGFFGILIARRPPVRGTILVFLIHCLVYYFVYTCIMTYFERQMWIEANEPARVSAFRLVTGHAASFWNTLVGVRNAARLDRWIAFMVKFSGVSYKTFPLPG